MKYEMNSIIKALEKSVIHSFANLVFVDIENYQKISSMDALDDHDYIATIELRKPFAGLLGLMVNKDFSQEMAATMLNGENQADSTYFIDAMMAEISNTIAGRFMAHLVADNKEFGFSLPLCSVVGRKKNLLSPNGKSVFLEFKSNGNKVYCFYKPE
jgi:CheY-specific phosphatase CheX